MRRFIPVSMAMLLAAGCTQGEIKGTITVGANPGNLVLFAGLWGVQAEPNDAGAATLAPASSGSAPTPLGQMAIGTVPANGGTFDYSFPGLSQGLYIVGAYLDSADDTNPDINDLIHTIDSQSVLQINPSVKSEQLVVHDLWVAISQPGTGTIRGTVNMSSAAAALPDFVWALDGPLLGSGGTPDVIAQQGVGGGASVSYSLFNLPLESLYIFANADVGDDGNLGNDILGFPEAVPVMLSAAAPEVDNVDIWLGAQDPNQGSISGTLNLNGALPASSSATVQLYAQNGGYEATNSVVSILNLPLTGASTPFTMPNVPFGMEYVAGTVSLTTGTTNLSGGFYYPGAPTAPAGLNIADATGISNVAVAVGIGEVDGTVTLENVPTTVQEVWLVASVMLNGSPFIVDGVPVDLSGSITPTPFAYTLFGLTDGTYDIGLIGAASMDESLDDALGPTTMIYPGQPAQIAIQGGDVASSNFDVNF